MLKRIEQMMAKMDEAIKTIAEVNEIRGEIHVYLPDDGKEETEMLNIITEWMLTTHHAYGMKKHMEKLQEIIKNKQ